VHAFFLRLLEALLWRFCKRKVVALNLELKRRMHSAWAVVIKVLLYNYFEREWILWQRMTWFRCL